jgi:SEC-C motif
MMLNGRSEEEVFADLVTLTRSPVYVHAMAQICHRDNFTVYRDTLKPSDMERMFDGNRLIRTEVTTLIGLMMRQPLDLVLPSVHDIALYVARTDELMEELHGAIARPMYEATLSNLRDVGKSEDVWRGETMREPIFYGSESAYSFQYRDLLPEKYGADEPWLIENVGFSIDQAQKIARAMCDLMDERATQMFITTKETNTQPETWLPTFEYTPFEISSRSEVAIEVVDAFLKACTLTSDNAGFRCIGDYNAVAGTPLLPTGRGTVLLFQHNAIYEALYESPFFWMRADESYRATAMRHRGAFTERYAAQRLRTVFGTANVHENINLQQGKDIVGEVDVLVVFGDRIIVVQAKAKKLTLEARKGNDGQLRTDFAAAIQKSYDQAWQCASAIVSGGHRAVTGTGEEIPFPGAVKEVYLVSVVSEHYPALAFQARQYLKYQTTDVIRAPFVMDVFLLDAMTEMLATPLRLLHYMRMRVAVVEQVTLSHELNALAFHLSRNVLHDEKYNMVMLDDSISVELETAMTVRRDGRPGERTPTGILTRMTGTLYERLISQIEQRGDPATLELGFDLLSMSENSCQNVHRALEIIAKKAQTDGKRHDVTLAGEGSSTGICLHCNPVPSQEAVAVLRMHCEKRKYAQRARSWFGVSISSAGDVQFGVTLDFPWSQSEEMDQLTRGMARGESVVTGLARLARMTRPQKIGRNDSCPCGSGKKFKKCCRS